MKATYRILLRLRAFGLLASALLLSSCATTSRPSAVGSGVPLPSAVAMNENAGLGEHLTIPIRLGTGEEVLFLVDTGSSMTILAEPLASGLGESLGTETLLNFGKSYGANCHRAPALYLGRTRLTTDPNVLVSGFVDGKASSDTGRPVMGILGMDCLQHYCIQLDFKTRKMRFIDPNHIEPAKLGTGFPLTFSTAGQDYANWIRPYIHCPGLAGGEPIDVLIDTGYNGDGGLEPETFRQAIREQRLRTKPDANDPQEPNGAEVTKCVWNDKTYTSVYLGKGENALGLRFLARHLVTFDFPHRAMYLKRMSSGPLASKATMAATKAAGRSTFSLARKLWKRERLPGWPKQDAKPSSATCRLGRDSDTVILDAHKKDDPSTYHYQFTRPSKRDPWKLQRAWRTNEDGQTTEEYPVP